MQMLSRGLRALKEGDVADASASLSYQDGRIAELEHFRSEAGERILSVVADYDAEKITLVIGEMQKIKSQIYYLQQSVLQMKTLQATAVAAASESETATVEETTSSPGSDNSVYEAAAAIELLKRNIAKVKESCLEKAEFEDFKRLRLEEEGRKPSHEGGGGGGGGGEEPSQLLTEV